MAMRAVTKDTIIQHLDILNERERRVLQLRFGLEDGETRTLTDIGRGMGVSKQRIRQIQVRALHKILIRARRSRGIPV